MEAIAAHFRERFLHWGIEIPPDDLLHRRRGKINRGWTIWYVFGRDERGEFLDYYSSHRMTSDDHVRVYASGESETLPSLPEMRPASRDPAEDARLAEKFAAKCRATAELLKSKGFWPAPDDSGAAAFNMPLRAGGIDLEKHDAHS